MPRKRSVAHSAGALRAYAFRLDGEGGALKAAVDAASDLGFAVVLALDGGAADPGLAAGPAAEAMRRLSAEAASRGLAVAACLRLDRISSVHPLVRDLAADAFRPAAAPGTVIDPRRPFEDSEGLSLLRRPEAESLLAWWSTRLSSLQALGVSRFAFLSDGPAARALAAQLRERGHGLDEITPVRELSAGSISPVLLGGPSLVRPPRERKRALMAAALALSPGWAMAGGFEAEVEAEVRSVNRLLAGRGPVAPVARALTGSGAPLRILASQAEGQALVMASNRSAGAQPWPPADGLLEAAGRLKPVEGFAPSAPWIAAGETLLFEARPRSAVASAPGEDPASAAEPDRRIVIADIAPSVDGGAHPVKCVVGERLEVTARIFADGHTRLAAELLTRADDEADWTRRPMTAEPNDLWRAGAVLSRLGRHLFMIEAWVDVWGGFAEDFAKKRAAGQDVSLEVREARLMIEAARGRADAAVARALAATLKALDKATPDAQAQLLLGPDLAAAMARADARPFRVASLVQPVTVDRIAARFSSWYELFPRSQTDDPARPGRFADVTARLPHIAAMGFDTLYFPPIHPIGRVNRKGRNNSLRAAPDDVGSPYAIGADEGGHDAIHPDLGAFDDFKALLAAARAHGLEVALDFAIQCAPDHPWIREHPGWFDWRPDGSIKYAENPPKKYQDIVNVDFYRPDSVPDLWLALRDVVLFWADAGVRTFRVDNPHTKPLPFWRWMIADLKARHPDLIFLSEAFTRPGPMYELAKAGFTQSYTYFTWRNAKSELTDYFTELNQAPARDIFRPHLFVNTPDINPFFLQTSGRAGFLIRAALAATLSGLFGVYAGFELCEAAPLPGREEYLDSEKYELRPRPDRAPGDIVDEIARLNAIRRSEPALQTHLGLSFHNAFNDQILYYSKSAPGQGGLVLAAVSLDPHHAQEADLEVPLWLFGLPDHGRVQVEDLVGGRRFHWAGKVQHLRLTPDDPYAIWRIAPAEG